MSKNYKPGHSSTVSPYLIVDGANKTIEFLKEVFGAMEVRRFSHAEGKIKHAEVRIDDSVIMIADGAPGWPPVQAHVHIYVPDVAFMAGADFGTRRRTSLQKTKCRMSTL